MQTIADATDCLPESQIRAKVWAVRRTQSYPKVLGFKPYDLAMCALIDSYYPDKMDDYKKMRESGEPDDELTQSLRKDDVDLLQSFILKNNFDVSNAKVPFNIYEEFVPNNSTNYINYSAAYGSIKCFKYLLLNHTKVDKLTYKFAVFGGSIEIIKIVDQKIRENDNSDIQSNNQKELPFIWSY